MKSLEAIQLAAKQWGGTTISTLLGAHVVPPEFRDRPDEYVRMVCEEMIPSAAQRGLAQFVDVFCERGAFTPEQSQRILQSAREHKLGVRAHICQLTAADLAPLLELDPASLDHMDFVRDGDLSLLAKSDTVATLLNASEMMADRSIRMVALPFGPWPPPRWVWRWEATGRASRLMRRTW